MKKGIFLSAIVSVLMCSIIAISGQVGVGRQDYLPVHNHSTNNNGGILKFSNLSGLLHPNDIDQTARYKFTNMSGIESNIWKIKARNSDKVDGYDASINIISNTIPVRNASNLLEAYGINNTLLNDRYEVNNSHVFYLDGSQVVSFSTVSNNLSYKPSIFSTFSSSGGAKIGGGLNSKYLSGTIANARFGNISSQKLTPQGTGSGLDADTLDGIDSLSFARKFGGGCNAATSLAAGAEYTFTETLITGVNSPSYIVTVGNTTGIGASACLSFRASTVYGHVFSGNSPFPTCPAYPSAEGYVLTVKNNDSVSSTTTACAYFIR